jgi:hypothetical protein
MSESSPPYARIGSSCERLCSVRAGHRPKLLGLERENLLLTGEFVLLIGDFALMVRNLDGNTLELLNQHLDFGYLSANA